MHSMKPPHVFDNPKAMIKLKCGCQRCKLCQRITRRCAKHQQALNTRSTKSP